MWTIHPRQGVNLWRFGMDATAIAGILGPPKSRTKIWNGTTAEDRGLTMPSCSYRDERLVGVGFAPACGQVMLADQSLFGLPSGQAIRALIAHNGGTARFGLGTFIFDALAMTAGDFLDGETGKFFEPQSHRGRDPRGITLQEHPDADWDPASFPPYSGPLLARTE